MSGKVSKQSVDYRPASALDKRDNLRCGTCTMFESGGQCTHVQGRIDPDNICIDYDPK